MAHRSAKTLTAPLIPLYRSAILAWLKQTGAQASGQIEAFIRTQFQGRWKARDRKINRRGIPQWRNDVHWALAYLTQHGMIVKGAGRYVAAADSAIQPRRKTPRPTLVKEAKPDSKRLFDSLTADILDALRRGTTPWRKLWGDLRRPKKQIDFAPLAIPTNAETGKPYIGVNIIILWDANRKRLLPESHWGTAQTWWRLGAEVKLQAEPNRVLAWVKVKEKDPEDDDDTRRPVWHRVFNLADVTGCDHLRQNQSPVRSIRKEGEIDTSRAWEFIQKCGAKVRWGGDVAYYDWKNDRIQMPHKQRFRSELDMITVLFHEMGHWTGHGARLNRPGAAKPFGKNTPEYAFEELVAELTTCFVLAYLGIPDRYGVGQHAGYIQGYIRLLENDRKALYRAAGRASRAARFLLDLFEGKR